MATSLANSLSCTGVETWVAFWRLVFRHLDPCPDIYIRLRWVCRMFRLVLPVRYTWACYPPTWDPTWDPARVHTVDAQCALQKYLEYLQHASNSFELDMLFIQKGVFLLSADVHPEIDIAIVGDSPETTTLCFSGGTRGVQPTGPVRNMTLKTESRGITKKLTGDSTTQMVDISNVHIHGEVGILFAGIYAPPKNSIIHRITDVHFHCKVGVWVDFDTMVLLRRPRFHAIAADKYRCNHVPVGPVYVSRSLSGLWWKPTSGRIFVQEAEPSELSSAQNCLKVKKTGTRTICYTSKETPFPEEEGYVSPYVSDERWKEQQHYWDFEWRSFNDNGICVPPRTSTAEPCVPPRTPTPEPCVPPRDEERRRRTIQHFVKQAKRESKRNARRERSDAWRNHRPSATVREIDVPDLSSALSGLFE